MTLCDYRECREPFEDTCFDCEDPICEQHAHLIPGFTRLRVCPACLARRIVKQIGRAAKQDIRQEALVRPSRAQKIRSLMEDSGYSRSEATALVDAGFSEMEDSNARVA